MREYPTLLWSETARGTVQVNFDKLQFSSLSTSYSFIRINKGKEEFKQFPSGPVFIFANLSELKDRKTNINNRRRPSRGIDR